MLIGARLRCERRPLALDPPAEAANHRLDDAVVTEVDAAVSENPHRQVAVAEMPGEQRSVPRRRAARFHDRLSGTGAVAPLGLTCFARTRPDSILLSGSGGTGDRGAVSARTGKTRANMPTGSSKRIRSGRQGSREAGKVAVRRLARSPGRCPTIRRWRGGSRPPDPGRADRRRSSRHPGSNWYRSRHRRRPPPRNG